MTPDRNLARRFGNSAIGVHSGGAALASTTAGSESSSPVKSQATAGRTRALIKAPAKVYLGLSSTFLRFSVVLWVHECRPATDSLIVGLAPKGEW